MKYGYLYEKDAAGKPRITLYHSTVCAFRRPFLPHHHTECELALIGSGTGIYTVKNRSFSFAAGDIFLFRGDELHCITEVCADEKFDVTNIHFEPSFVWSGEGLGSPSLWRLFCDRSPRFENRIERNNPQTAKIAEKIRRIEEELREQKFEYGLCVRNLLSDILLTLCRDYGYIDLAHDRAPSLPDRNLCRVTDYIEEHLSEKITLASLASVCGMNRTYFCGVFKRFYGVSPFEYITVKRVEYAQELMRTTDRTRADIAGECGFSSLSNFYRALSMISGKRAHDENNAAKEDKP